MYDEIKLQPQAIGRALSLAEDGAKEITSIVGRARRVFVVGCGTSFHAAQVGAWMLRTFSRGKIDARAVEAFEFAVYLPGLRNEDLLIAVTHSGETGMVVRALERAQRAGVESVAVTGFPGSRAGALARWTIPTGYEEERSWAHTVSYTAALASLAALANSVAEATERLDLSPLPELVSDVLGLEEMGHRMAASTIMAEHYREPVKIVLVGGGPNAATASEGVLKLLETSYVQATAFELEEMLHGPMAALTPEHLVIVLVPSGASVERAVQFVAGLQELQVTPVVFTPEETGEPFEHTHRFILPDLPEVLSPIPYVVPLQLFAYYLAVGKGFNPDLLHRDDERFAAARVRL